MCRAGVAAAAGRYGGGTGGDLLAAHDVERRLRPELEVVGRASFIEPPGSLDAEEAAARRLEYRGRDRDESSRIRNQPLRRSPDTRPRVGSKGLKTKPLVRIRVASTPWPAHCTTPGGFRHRSWEYGLSPTFRRASVQASCRWASAGSVSSGRERWARASPPPARGPASSSQ